MTLLDIRIKPSKKGRLVHRTGKSLGTLGAGSVRARYSKAPKGMDLRATWASRVGRVPD